MNSIFIYDVFTSKKFGGNQAGVVIQEKILPKEEKQLLAKELNFSETVFISKAKGDIWKLEYFTPKEEIDLCGHATIAAIYALFDEKRLVGYNEVKIETRVGILKIYLEVVENKLEKVWMEQGDGKISLELEVATEDILESLSLKKDEIREDIPILKGYSGLWDLMIPVKTRDILNRIKMDIEKVKIYSEKLSVISFHPFFLSNNEVYVRNFAPIVDIIEESATGTSNGALSYTLEKLGFLSKEEELICHQGERMGRPSVILAKVLSDGRILVGGQAVKVLKGKYC